MVDQLAEEYADNPVYFLEYDVDNPPSSRYSRWWAAYGGSSSVYLPLVMVDSGNQISNGSVDFYNVYKPMVNAALARPAKAAITAYSLRIGNKLRFFVRVTNHSGTPLSYSSNGAAVHAVVWEDVHVADTNRFVRAAVSKEITSSIVDGATSSFILETPELTGVAWNNLHAAVLADYRPAGLTGAYDMLEAALALPLRLDFNEDGKPDILWRNTSTGENYIWYLDGVTVLGGGSLPPVTDQNWKAVGAADFNNDGKPDVLWRNTSTGENYIWHLDGVTVMGGGSLPTVAEQNWKVVGVADFNNDGKPDVLWRNTSTGENYIWYLDGVTVMGGGSLPAVVDQNWKLVGVADFNINGDPDILWRNTSTGENYIWYMDGVTVLGGGSLPAVADQNWKLIGAVDFNLDGRPDVLWRHGTTGENYVWYLDGVTVMGGGSLPTVADQNWTIVP